MSPFPSKKSSFMVGTILVKFVLYLAAGNLAMALGYHADLLGPRPYNLSGNISRSAWRIGGNLRVGIWLGIECTVLSGRES